MPDHLDPATARYRWLYDELMVHRTGRDNDNPLASMLASHYGGGGALPPRLGLEPRMFARMVEHHFAGVQLPKPNNPRIPLWDPRLLEEKGELVKLMLMYRAQRDDSEIWMSRIVATGCMASNHLWQDLGLWGRGPLSELMSRNFPGLAAKNDRDMKWKKFLYKQLCIQEGIYICRAPSCELCSDYQNCFGPEE